MNLKERLRSHELAAGSWITIGHTAVAEIMAQAGNSGSGTSLIYSR